MGAGCRLARTGLQGACGEDGGSGLTCGSLLPDQGAGPAFPVNGELTEPSILGGGVRVTSRPDVLFCLPGASEPPLGAPSHVGTAIRQHRLTGMWGGLGPHMMHGEQS